MNFVPAQTILSRRHSGKRKFYQNKGFPTVKGFTDVELEESTYYLQNFDQRLIKLIGSFRCFLRWKGHKYRVKFEVMGIDTPNLLSRETTFLMGILKKCLSVEKAPNEPENVSNNVQKSSLSVPGPTKIIQDIQLCPQKVYFVIQFGQRRKSTLPFSSIHRRKISNELCQHPRYGSSFRIRSNSVSGLTKPSLLIADLPLTQEKVESSYADVFQGLGKFPGDPYKLRLKPDAVPAKHRPRKVPVHLQDAFCEEVE